MSAGESNLPKLSLLNSVSSDPFSSGAAFIEIGDFVNRCFPDTPVDRSWGTLFVVVSDLAQLSDELGLTISKLLLLDDSILFDSVDKRVVFVASAGPSGIISEQCESFHEAFELVERGKHLASPAVLIHTSRSPRVNRFFWSGLEKPEDELKTYVGGEFARLTLANFPEALKWIDENSVCVAGNINHLWQLPEKTVPIKNAERAVQHLLRNGLSIVLGKDYVLEECSNSAGRADILILPSSSKFPTHYIELKVVRTYHSVSDPKNDTPRKVYKASNQRWVLSAILQAAKYKGKNNNALAHARIYDMREDKSELIPSQVAIDAAQRRSVLLASCHLHSNTEKLRGASND